MADNHYLQYQLIGQIFLFLINSLENYKKYQDYPEFKTSLQIMFLFQKVVQNQNLRECNT